MSNAEESIHEATTVGNIEVEKNISEDFSHKRKRDDEPSLAQPEGSNVLNNQLPTEDTTKKVKADEELLNKPATVSAALNTNYPNYIPSNETSQTNISSPQPIVNQTNHLTVPSMTLSTTGDSITLEVAPEKVGQIIGSRGAIIQDIQTRTGAKAFINQDFPPGVNRQIHITGTPSQCKDAAELIRMIIKEGPTSIHVNSLTGGAQIHSVIECTQSVVGRVIGTSGATIKEIQSKSGARIQIEQDFPPEVPRKINITGTTTAVSLAMQMVNKVIETGSLHPPATAMPAPGPVMGGMYGNQPMYGAQPPMAAPPIQSYPSNMNGSGNVTQSIEIPRAFVGKVIGKGGEVVTLIQSKSQCKVQVEQNVPDGQPCRVVITGMAQNVSIATQLVNEVMQNVPMNRLGSGIPSPSHMQVNPYMQMAPQNPYGMQPQYGGMQQVQPMQQMPSQYGYGYQPQPQPQPHMQQPYGIQPAPVSYQPYGAAANQGGYVNPYGGNPGVVQHSPRANPVINPQHSVWSEHKTDDGVPYWHNASTGVSQWERPTA